MDASVDQAAFRGALSRFASGVTVVSTTDGGLDHAMTASAFTSVSLIPPLVLVCSNRGSRFHDAVRRSRRWAVSVLSEEGREASAWFAHRGRPLESQFDDVAHHRSPDGLPLLDHALSWLECRTVEEHDGGDHLILVGEVTWAAFRDDIDDPLLYYRSHYGTVVRQDESEKTVYGGGET